ncbi:hypothetical protein LCGC14_2150800, partial [marine sediment metagenome]
FNEISIIKANNFTYKNKKTQLKIKK